MIATWLLAMALGDAPTVGMSGRLDQVVLPGTELEARPGEGDKAPIVLRIVDSYAHGTMFRYDFEYYGLEPGTYDLKDYLARKDGSSTADLPALKVEVKSALPPGHVPPSDPEAEGTPRLWGYRLAFVLGALAWTAGLLAILLVGRRKARRDALAIEAARPVGDRLRPLIAAALDGTLPKARRPELERTLIAALLRKHGMEGLRPSEAIVALKERPDSAKLVTALEEWLHRPQASVGPGPLEALAPYRDLPAEDWEPAAPELMRAPS